MATIHPRTVVTAGALVPTGAAKADAHQHPTPVACERDVTLTLRESLGEIVEPGRVIAVMLAAPGSLRTALPSLLLQIPALCPSRS